MHVLFVSWWWPYPADNGAKKRVYHLVRHLSGRHRVTLLSFAEHGDATPERVAHLRRFCAHVEAVPKPRYRPGSARAVAGLLSRWPRSLVDVYSRTMAERVREVATHDGVDVLIACEMQTMRYGACAPRLPTLVDDLELTRLHDECDGAAGMLGRQRARLTWTKMAGAVRRVADAGAGFSVVSEVEARVCRALVPADTIVEVVPNGVDVDADDVRASVGRPHASNRRVLLYTGAITYDANLDAVRYFARDILPRLDGSAPAVEFVVTGATGPHDLVRLAAGRPNVRFTGHLPSLTSMLTQAAALVVPLRIGSGTRLKILEAMAAGVPVVSTRKGAEGLAVVDDEHLLLADGPEAFAAAVGRLLCDDALRGRLTEAARRRVEREYDWQTIGARLEDVLRRVSAPRVRPRARWPGGL